MKFCHEHFSEYYFFLVCSYGNGNFKMNNVPVKQDSSYHGKVLFFNIVFLGLLIFGAVCLNRLFGLEIFLPMVIISYLCYLCSAICCSEIKDYLDNMKKYDQYQ